MLSEMKVCRQEDCDIHHWQTGIWSQCVASNATVGCGKGYRTRDVACVLRSEDIGGVRMVADWKCRQLERPPVSQVCFKTCPQDCLLTEWSDWTPCRQNCDASKCYLGLRPSSWTFSILFSLAPPLQGTTT